MLARSSGLLISILPLSAVKVATPAAEFWLAAGELGMDVEESVLSEASVVGTGACASALSALDSAASAEGDGACCTGSRLIWFINRSNEEPSGSFCANKHQITRHRFQ